MVEQKHCTQDYPFTIINILPVQHVTVFRQIADEFGVNIIELASAGQSYTETCLDQQGKKYIHIGIVPKGHARIEIVHSTQYLNNFYDRAGQVLAEMKTSKNKS
jgi:hypothetical protein